MFDKARLTNSDLIFRHQRRVGLWTKKLTDPDHHFRQPNQNGPMWCGDLTSDAPKKPEKEQPVHNWRPKIRTRSHTQI